MSDKLQNVFYVALARRSDSVTIAEWGQQKHAGDVGKLIGSPAFREKALPGKHISLKVKSQYFLHMLGNESGLVVVVVTDANYPQRVVYSGFCEDLFKAFNAKELQWQGCNAGAMTKKFKREMESLCKEYDDVNSKSKLSKLRAEVDATKGVMQDNISKALNNLEATEVLEDKAEDLMVSAKDFNKKAKKLACKEWCMLQKMRAMIFMVLVLVIIVIVVAICMGSEDACAAPAAVANAPAAVASAPAAAAATVSTTPSSA
jgi:hypothetical protein